MYPIDIQLNRNVDLKLCFDCLCGCCEQNILVKAVTGLEVE